MQYGWIKAATGTPKIRVADCAYNGEATAALMRQAEDAGAQLLILPELGLTGYTAGDLFLQEALLHGALKALERVLEESRGLDLLTAVGLPLQKDGKLYNCAAVLHRGKLLGVVPKTHLPNYNEYYEQRHFTPAPEGVGQLHLLGQTCPFGTNLLFQCEALPGAVLSIEICEDLWVPNPPSIRHAMAGATLIGNLSAGDEVIGKAAYRRALVAGQSARLSAGYLYACAGDGESTTDMVFSGHSLIAENGSVLAESSLFQNTLLLTEIDVQRLRRERRRMNTFAVCGEGYVTVPFSLKEKEIPLTRAVPALPFVPEGAEDRRQRCESILTMQCAGLTKRLAHIGCKTAVLGISGGLDSTLALLVTARAMDALHRPHTDILAVTMPCFGTTARTKSNAQLLCEALGVTFQEVDISASVRRHFEDIGQSEQVLDVTYENSQARERTQVLMDLANRTGGIVIGTGDLSELALGWATYNGDHMSMYGVNASIPKTLVRYLVEYAADTAESELLRSTLLDVLDTPVSPELLPAENGAISQKTEDIVGPYELHDFFLYYVLRWGFSPKKIFALAQQAFQGQYGDAVILSWLQTFYRRFFSQQFKRSCLPDGPKVGTVSLSPRGDWRMPSDACATLWLRELDAIQL